MYIYTYKYNGILLGHKKRWNTAICNTMDGPWEYDAKWNKSVRKSEDPCDFTHMWDIKLKAINEQTRQTKTHTHGQQYGGYQRERGRE